MSTDTILLFAIGVFALMALGMILTMLEFRQIAEQNRTKKQRKKEAKAKAAKQAQQRPHNLTADSGSKPSTASFTVIQSADTAERKLQ